MSADERTGLATTCIPTIDQRIEEAEVLFSQGRLLEAEERFRTILREWPGHVRVSNNLACLLWQSGRLVEAFRQFFSALSMAPDNREIVWNSGQVFFHVGQRSDAVRVYRRYLRTHPGDAEIATALRQWEGFVM
jgi:Flp pilus assembly protein TadD